MDWLAPSIERARGYRLAMDRALWSRVHEWFAPEGQPLAAGEPGAASFLDYGAYFDLAAGSPFGETLPDGGRASARDHFLRRQQTAPAPVPRLSAYSAEHYPPDQLERMQRWWDWEADNRMTLAAPDEAEYERSRRLIGVAIEHLRLADPELSGEIETIVHDIVVMRCHETSAFDCSAASSSTLWGAMIVNARHYDHWVWFYRQIAHEAGHNLLYAISRDDALVANDLSDRLASPIRTTLRPVEGVFQAAFVSAREVLALDALLRRHESAGSLTDEEADLAWDLLEMSGLAFWDCAENLRQGARLTELGTRILADCEAYMAANFAIEAG